MQGLKLKSLIMHGFKSFADKTSFDFHDGTTVLVGPNGCGKSNIVDAIKWVLGDQSAKSVRGKEMTDVIFNGSDKRPPTGVAEVSLVFDNESRQLPLDYETVMVTRRLHRDGQSEYELNKNACRLRDIREVFLDTGIGVDAYSIIEQGRVASFIQANAKERRQIFEEASGISRLKTRKKEALSKLKRSSQNLERLHDIVEEVSRRLARVKRQAEKAQRYQELMSSYKEKRLTVSIVDYETLQAEENQVSAELKEKEKKLVTLQGEQGAQDAVRLAIDEELALSNRQIQELSTELVRIDGDIQRSSDVIEMHAKQIMSLEEEGAKRDERLEAFAHRKQIIQKGIDQLGEKMQVLQADLESVDKSVRQAEQHLEDREEALLALSGELEEKRSHVTTSESRLDRLIHQQETTSLQLERFNREWEEASEKKRSFDKEVDFYNERKRALSVRVEDLTFQRDEMLQLITKQEEEALQIGNEVSRVDTLLTEARLETSRKKAEQKLLDDLEKQHAGVSDAVKSLLEQGKENAGLLSGFVGLVAELLEAPQSIARAVDAALGHRSQIVVLESKKLLADVDQFLTQQSLGQVGVLVLDSLPTVAKPDIPLNLQSRGRLIDHIQIEEPYRTLFEHLLGSWVLVDEETDLTALPEGISAVTPSGRRRDGWGLFVLGRSGETSGLVSRRSALSELDDKLEALVTDESSLERQLQDLVKAQDHHESLVSDLATRQVRFESSLAARQSDLHVMTQEANLLQDRLERLIERMTGIDQERQALDSECRQMAQEITQLNTDIPTAKGEVEQLTLKQQEESEKQEKDREHLVSERMRQNSIESEKQQLQSTLYSQKESLADLNQDEERVLTEKREAINRITGLNEESEKNQGLITEAFEQKKEVEDKLGQARLARGSVEERKKELDQKLATIIPELNDLQGAVSTLKVKERETVLRRESLTERIKEDYEIDIAQVASQWEGLDDESIDLDEWRRDCDELKQKIDKLGPVNLEALQEETELDERHTFLAEQEKDLKAATKQLEEVVDKIDTRARDLFVGTFEAVREHFKVTFRQLFGGGRADLKLEEVVDGDILDSGIEITACPPGKEPRSITLLSGGEKTMTAVALLFAIFKSRPSPFCILDEVDAALDESNIDRWLAMLDKFKETSQFLVISHAKRTMKEASRIYGVTMQEPGVSCKLSLQFDDVTEGGDFKKVPTDKVA